MNTKLPHLDFAASGDEARHCVWCGEAVKRVHDYYMVTPHIAKPINGWVALCESCAWFQESRPTQRNIERKWRKTAPEFISIAPDWPVHLVVRQKCNDHHLAEAIREVFARIPRTSRNKVLSYAAAERRFGLSGLRFECLGRWAGMGDAAGMNMVEGHVIRLRASFVKRATPDALLATIAHELGHTEQNAEDLTFQTPNECELDVEKRIAEWGFAKENRAEHQSAVSQLDAIVRRAREVKKAIQNSHCPSGNYVTYSARYLRRAYGALWDAERRWKGSDV